jgi:hypothetical protein
VHSRDVISWAVICGLTKQTACSVLALFSHYIIGGAISGLGLEIHWELVFKKPSKMVKRRII